MKVLLTFTLYLLSLSLYSQSQIRVTSEMNLQEVINDANSGDILLVEAGTYPEKLFINKPISIIGKGYFQNITEGDGFETKILDVNLVSNNVYLSGLSELSVNIGASNCLIEKCKINSVNLGRAQEHIDSSSKTYTSLNVTIKKNYIKSGAWFSGIVKGFLFRNNLLESGVTFNGDIQGIVENNTFGITDRVSIPLISAYSYQNSSQFDLLFKNNLFSRIYLGSSSNYSNPVRAGIRWFNNSFNNSGSEFMNTTYGSGNIFNVDEGFLYISSNGNYDSVSLDKNFQLSPNSLVRGIGVNGEDLGAFGGDDPYVLGGIPSIPNINQLNVPTQVPQNGILNVQIKARTND